MIPQSYQVSFAEYSSDQLDESTHKSSSFSRTQHLFSAKKDRKLELKVAPFPSPSYPVAGPVRKPVKARLRSAMFSRASSRINYWTVLGLAGCVGASYAFGEPLKPYETNVATGFFCVAALFLLRDCAKFAAIGCRSFRDRSQVIDTTLTVGSLLCSLLVLKAHSSLWDCSYILPIARLFYLSLAYKKTNELRPILAPPVKAASISPFSIELASDKVQQVLRSVLEQPWVAYISNLEEELRWCLDVIVSNRLNQTILNVGNAEPGLQESELVAIVNQYSKAGDPPSVLLPRKTGFTTPVRSREAIGESEMTEEVKSCFREVDSCEFDIFRLKNATKGNELLALLHLLFFRHDLLSTLALDERRFTNYISRVQGGYNSTVLYHNATHAADVTQTLHYFIYACDAVDILSLSALEVAGAYLAAAVHDYEHPGLTNSYLVNTQAELAIRYNDKSVLESHHISAAFALALDETCDVYSDLTSGDFSKLRNLMIGMVLATDAVNHFSSLSRFKANVESGVWRNAENVDQTLELLLHSADISNPTKPWGLCQRWAELVLNEFWLQGDKERKLGLPLSFLSDRYSVNVPKSQIGFIDVIVSPLFDALSRCFKSVEANCVYLAENRERWSTCEKGTQNLSREL